jgi:hypothetical protein
MVNKRRTRTLRRCAALVSMVVRLGGATTTTTREREREKKKELHNSVSAGFAPLFHPPERFCREVGTL